MEVKNKELKKLYDSITLYFDSWCLPSLITAFMVCDDAIEGEIAAIKAELAEAKRGRAIFRADADHLRNMVFEKGNELRLANNEIESLKKTIDELKEKLNVERKHGEDLADINGQLASENVDLKAKVTLLETSRITWLSRAQHAEKAVTLADINCRLASENVDLKAKVSDLEKELAEARNSTELHLRKENERLRGVIDGLEKENASLRVTPPDVNVIESMEKENSELKTSNERLNAKYKSYLKELFEARIEAAQYKKSFMEHYEENDRLRSVVDTLEKEINTLKKKVHDLEIVKRPWHGDGNAMTDECSKSLAETIEFQNKKIEELEAEKARLKEAYDIHETTIKKENVDLSYGHEFEFGDEVFVPWSDGPYMYVKSGLMYNPRTERLVYVGKDQHLKWFGEKFSIV